MMVSLGRRKEKRGGGGGRKGTNLSSGQNGHCVNDGDVENTRPKDSTHTGEGSWSQSRSQGGEKLRRGRPAR